MSETAEDIEQKIFDREMKLLKEFRDMLATDVRQIFKEELGNAEETKRVVSSMDYQMVRLFTFKRIIVYLLPLLVLYDTIAITYSLLVHERLKDFLIISTLFAFFTAVVLLINRNNKI